MFRIVLLLVFVVSCLLYSAAFAQKRQLTLDDVFPDDRVLNVQITVAPRDWDKIRYQRRDTRAEFQPGRQFEAVKPPYVYVTASQFSIDGVEFGPVAIRKKGFLGSQNSTRPSLKVKLNHVDKQAGIGGLTTLTLNNNQQA